MISFNPKWRILTVGDGDLSFSSALASKLQPNQLTASIFDSESLLSNKYGAQYLEQLRAKGISVLTSLDVTNPSTWQALTLGQFDVVIFQFPLVPSAQTAKDMQTFRDSSNTSNRWLLHRFLDHCFTHFLAPDGQRLAVITSKDVKPYRQWNIETSLTSHLTIDYLGQCPFDMNDFAGYQVRNVDRDKFVKETQAFSYWWSDRPQPALTNLLTIPAYCRDENYCALCRVGPINYEADWQAHFESKRHCQMLEFESQWQRRLSHYYQAVD